MRNLRTSIFQLIKFLPSKLFPFIGNYLLIFLISANISLIEYGEFYFLVTIFTAIYTFSLSVIPQLVMRYCENVNILYSLNFIFFYLFAFFIAIIIISIYFYFFPIKENLFYIGIIYIFSYSIIEIVLALSRLGNKYFNFVNILKSYLPLIFIYVLQLWNIVNIINIFIVYISSFLIISLFFLNFYNKNIKIRKLELNNKAFFSYYLHLSIITGCLFLNNKLNFIISKNIFEKNTIGIFSFNFDFFERILQNMTSMLNIAFTVTAYKLYDENNLNKLKSFLKNNLFIYIIIIAPLIIFFLFFNQKVFSFMGRNNYILDLKYLFFLLFSFFFIGLGHRFSIVFLVTKSTNTLAFLTFLSLFFSVLINYFFVKYYKVTGLYLSQFFSSFIWFFLLYISSRKKIKFI